MANPTFLKPDAGGTILAAKVQPRASANAIAGTLGDELKIKITAPPVDAKANEALEEFLAETLQCSRRDVRITRGHKSRHKTIHIAGLEPEEVQRRLGV